MNTNGTLDNYATAYIARLLAAYEKGSDLKDIAKTPLQLAEFWKHKAN